MKKDTSNKNNKSMDQILQSQKLTFSFVEEQDKLIIIAECPKLHSKYIGQIDGNIDFQDIKEIINQNQFKTIIRNQETFKIKAGPVNIQLVSKEKSQLKQIQQQLKKSQKKQQQMEQIILSQQKKINHLQIVINEMKKTVDDLKSGSKIAVFQSQRLNEDINKKLKQVGGIVQKIQQQKALKQQQQSLKWTELFKSSNIEIQGNVITNKKLEIYSLNFCMLDNGFKSNQNQRQKWKFKIIQKTNWILLGICLGRKIFNNKFVHQCLTKKVANKHGFYLVSAYGYCFSHSDPELNGKEKNFRFETGDVIECEYDPINQKLSFKNGRGKYFEMSIINPPENDQFHPCVLLNGLNDSVQLFVQDQNK